MFQLTRGCIDYPNRVKAEPQKWEFVFRGKNYFWDANAMVLACDYVPRSFQAVDWKPVFGLGCTPAIPYLVLEVTDCCNMNCKYCFVSEDSARPRESKFMEFSTAASAIAAFIFKNLPRTSGKDSVSIGFFGGEPLMCKGLIQQVVSFVESVAGKNRVSFHITTNGTLLDESFIRFMSEHNFSLIVSLDGPEEYHNSNRVYKDSRGSFEDVMKSLNMLRSYAPRISDRTTLRATYTNEFSGSMVDCLEFLNTLCDNGFANNVSFEPAFLGESVCFDKSKVKELTPDPLFYFDRWIHYFDELADWYLHRILKGKKVRYHHFNCFIRRLLVSQPQPSECGAGRGYFSIGTDGTIYACHRETMTGIGHLYKGGMDHELAAPWQDNRYYARKRCPDCEIRNICGGGCRETSIVAGRSISDPEPLECMHKKIWFFESAHIISEAVMKHPPSVLKDIMVNVGIGGICNTCEKH